MKGGANVSVGILPPFRALETIDTFDRPGNAFATSYYADARTYADGGGKKPGKRLPKAGAYAGAGVGHARAEWSVFDAEAKGPNASAGAEASVLSVGAFAKAEVGSASASAARILEAEAKGPNAGAGAGVSVESLGAEAFAKAQLASVSVSAGPVKATLGLAADTGVGIGATGLEVKVLGTGFSIGPKTSVSLFGTGVECNIM